MRQSLTAENQTRMSRFESRNGKKKSGLLEEEEEDISVVCDVVRGWKEPFVLPFVGGYRLLLVGMFICESVLLFSFDTSLAID